MDYRELKVKSSKLSASAGEEPMVRLELLGEGESEPVVLILRVPAALNLAEGLVNQSRRALGHDTRRRR